MLSARHSTAGKVVARKPTGEEISLETSELVKRTGAHLGPKELGLLAKQLAAATNAADAARIRERIARGFYGISSAARPPL